jgi:hypothetical protein
MAWRRLRRSLPRSYISWSKTLIKSYEWSIDARNFPPSLCQRLMRSTSALRRRCFVSILSQSLHFWELCRVCMMSFMPQVSPVRYSRLQCCRKCPHFQSPQANLCWSKKHMFDLVWFLFSAVNHPQPRGIVSTILRNALLLSDLVTD